MKILKSKRNGNTVALEAEAPAESLSVAMDVVYPKVSKNAQVAGFRKGKLPRAVFERHFGRELLIQEAIYEVVNNTYRDAIKELTLKVIDHPRNLDIDEYKESKPIRFRCDVDVEPEVKLGKYKGVKVKQESAEVADADVEQELNRIREGQAEFSEVDRGVEKDDIIRFSIAAKIAGEPYELWTRQNAGLRVGVGGYGDDFDAQVLGLKKGEKKAFEVSYPEPFPANADVAGKTVAFDIEVQEVRGKKLPELTDALVEKVTKEFKTVSDYRKSIQDRLSETKKKEVEAKVRDAVVDAVLDDVELEIPVVMIEREVDRALYFFELRLREAGLNMKNYAEIIKKGVEDLRGEMRPSSEKRVKTTLVFDAIREKEKIEVTDADLEKEIASWNMPEIKTLEEARKSGRVDLESLRQSVLDRQTVDLLVSLAKISS